MKKNGSADIKLVENGYFTINTLTEDEKLTLLFDEKGNLIWKTVSNFNDPSTMTESYTTYYYGVTYEVKFGNSSPDKLKNVYVVTVDQRNEETYIPCVYNEEKDSWIGSYEYNGSSNMPVAITAAYEIAGDKEIADMFDEKTINNFSENFSELTETLAQELDKRLESLEIVDVSDTGFSIKLGIRGDDDVVSDFGILVY